MVCHKIGICIYKLQFPRFAMSLISGDKVSFPLKTEKIFQIYRGVPVFLDTVYEFHSRHRENCRWRFLNQSITFSYHTVVLTVF